MLGLKICSVTIEVESYVLCLGQLKIGILIDFVCNNKHNRLSLSSVEKTNHLFPN